MNPKYVWRLSTSTTNLGKGWASPSSSRCPTLCWCVDHGYDSPMEKKLKNRGKIRFYPHSTSFYPINSFFTILTIWAPVPGPLPGNRKNIQIPDVVGLPQSCNVSRTETYHVQIVFNVFKKGMCTWRKPEFRKKTWGTYSQFSTCLKYSPTMGNQLVHRKSPHVLLWNVSSLALTCRTLKTSADQTEPQFVSAWRGEMWKKQMAGRSPSVGSVWSVDYCCLLLI